MIGKRCGKGILPGLDHHLDLDPPVDLGEAVHTERGLPLIFKDYLRPQVAGVRRHERLAFPTERQGQRAGGEPNPIFQDVIQIHWFSPLAG